MTTITLSLVATAPPGETDPTAWTLGYIAGILRAQGVTVRSIVAEAEPPLEQAIGMDLGPGVRRALATAAKLADELDAHTDALAGEVLHPELVESVTCEWCDRPFRPRGLPIHKARCKQRPPGAWGPRDPGAEVDEQRRRDRVAAAVTPIIPDDDREARHAARRAAAAEAM